MSTPARRRLLKDLAAITALNESTIFAQPLEEDMLIWTAIIIGPKGTPYENGTFSLVMVFDEEYPNHPPEVTFISKMFHPNIYANGDLCLDLLRNRWSPSYDILGILMSIQSLLNDPNIKSPANIEAAKVFDDDTDEFERRVKETVEMSWSDVENMVNITK